MLFFKLILGFECCEKSFQIGILIVPIETQDIIVRFSKSILHEVSFVSEKVLFHKFNY
jgi:hypothetical protein